MGVLKVNSVNYPVNIMSQHVDLTLFILTYNQEEFVRDSVLSALNQDYEKLEIIISDDFSTDRTFEIINDVVSGYKGPHNLRIYRNKKNMGIVEHINYVVFDLIKTRKFVVQAGDDISCKNRVKKIAKYFEENNDVYAICSNAIMIDDINEEMGTYIKKDKFTIEKRDFYNVMEKGSQFFGAAAAYDMVIFEYFGRLKSNVRNEDQILPLRASLIGKIGYISDPLIKYRIHKSNLSFWIQAKDAHCGEFLEVMDKNYENQIINLENAIQDIKKIGGEDKLEQILLKVRELMFRRYLLSNKFISRVLKVLRSKQKLSQVTFIMAISPCLYRLLSRRR